MKANELRIGNNVDFNVKIPNENKLIHVSRGKITYIIDCFVGINGVRVDLDSLNPIKLTEEILLKCGFKFNQGFINAPHYSKNGLIISMNFYVLGINNNHSKIQYQLKYLHQLQNLYFCLTGQELEINL